MYLPGDANIVRELFEGAYHPHRPANGRRDDGDVATIVYIGLSRIKCAAP